MIYIFPRVPKAAFPLPDLTKSFNNFATNAEVSQRIQKISKLRENFYTVVDQIEKKAPNQIVSEFDWMGMFEYLQVGPDLLELGVKCASYPFNFKYTSVLCPSKDIIINDGTVALANPRQRGRSDHRDNHEQVRLCPDCPQEHLRPSVPGQRGYQEQIQGSGLESQQGHHGQD